jgi:glycosyltransferase involved in cell wall biosynthesis
MKICVVSLNIVPFYQRSSGSQYGGAEVQTAVLADAFAAAGAEVSLVVRDLDAGASLPHPAHNAFASQGGVPGLRLFYPRVPGVLDALARADADVYFQHCAGLETGLTAWHCRRSGRAFVYFAGSDTDFSRREVRVDGWRDRLFFFWGLKKAAAVVAQNEAQAAMCRNQLGRDATVIPTAVALSDSSGADDDGTVVWIGGLRGVKGPEVFIELARRMPERRFVMIGGKIASESEYGQRVAAAAECVPNLTATGRISHDEVDAYLRRAALLVNTSRLEGFPNAFLEAWQNRTPVVSLVDVDGLIAGEDVGVVCAGTDEMAAAVRRLLDDDAGRRAMGDRARSLIESRYGAPALARRYMELFEGLVSR